ncbi:MAG: hypothetical protein IPK04_03985 [Bdellovibrionales bacterium]|nr:hypothetical protein [Bdellovibrionales bacterium]
MGVINQFSNQIIDSFQELILLRMFRHAFELNPQVLSSEFEVKAAETADEYFEALGLLHHCYVRKGLMTEDPRRIRLGLHHLLPETNIIMVRHKGICVGTGTVIHRGDFPFPAQKAFGEEAKKTLDNQASVLEFSGLAVHPDYRAQGNAIQLLMIKFYIQLINRIYKNPYTICSIHPNAEKFYRLLVGFRKSGPMLNYDFVSGAKAIYMEGSTTLDSFAARESHFSGKTERDNFSLFLLSPDSRLIFPSVSRNIHFGKELLKNLLDDIYPRLLEDANLLQDSEVRLIHEVKRVVESGKSSSGEIQFIKGPRPYRLRTSLPVSTLSANEASECTVVNMNEDRVLLRAQNVQTFENLGKLLELVVNVNGAEYKLYGSIVRINVQQKIVSEVPSATMGPVMKTTAEIGLKLKKGNSILTELLSQEVSQKEKTPLKIAS